MRLVLLQRLVVAAAWIAAPFTPPGLWAQTASLQGAMPEAGAAIPRFAEVRMPTGNSLFMPANVETGGISSSNDGEPDAPEPSGGQRFEKAPTGRNRGRMPRDPNYGHIGAALSFGASGLTGDLAFPINRFFDFRLGASGFRYSRTFLEQSSDPTLSTIPVYGNLQIAYGKAQVDVYPFAGHLRISPMLVFANFTHGIAAVQFEGGKEFDFEDGSFISSATDPVRGYGRVDFKHTAPGLTIGLNNFTRGYGRFTFPIEIGAFHTGAPDLQIQFQGTVCDNTSCNRVQDDADFQKQIDSIKTRINKDLNQYARWVPVVNIGVGYRFGFNGR